MYVSKMNVTVTIIESMTYAVSIILHCIGFVLLYQTKYKSTFSQVQRFYLLNLSFFEIIMACSLLTMSYFPFLSREYFLLEYLTLGGVVTMIVSMYFLITLDRLLIVYLNIRYNTVVTVKRVRWIFCGFYGISFTQATLFFTLNLKLEIVKIYKTYVFLTVSFLYILFAGFVYTYISLSNRRRERNLSIQTSRQRKCTTVLPMLLITTFIAFFIIPSIIIGTFYLHNSDMPDDIKLSMNVMYAVGLATDAVLYIFSMKRIKRKLQWKCKSTKTDSTAKTSNISIFSTIIGDTKC